MHKTRLSLVFQTAVIATIAVCCVGTLHPGHHGRLDELPGEEPYAKILGSLFSDKGVQPAVTGKIMPVFFERASKVVIQLVKDNLKKAKIGDLETYADGDFLHRCLKSNARHAFCPG